MLFDSMLRFFNVLLVDIIDAMVSAPLQPRILLSMELLEGELMFR